MVAAYRTGASLREVAKDFNESTSTIQRRVAHAQGKRLDRVDFYDKPTGTQQPKNKSTTKLEKRVLQLRKYLRDKSILGQHGAEAIREEMKRRGNTTIPAKSTISNILKRNGRADKCLFLSVDR